MVTALSALSDDIAALVAGVAPRIVGVRGADGTIASGMIWRTGLVVSAHEALGGEEEFSITFADGSSVSAEAPRRDPSTDVALLRAATPEFADFALAPTPAAGSLAVICGWGEHGATAALAGVNEAGPAWRSMRGGEIDARIVLGVRLSGRTEGAPVLAPDGGLIGMAVIGPRRSTLAIPGATISRVVGLLADKGYIPRGFLGVSLHQLGEDGGAIVVGLESGAPAEGAGLLVGDIITTWGAEPVRSVADVMHRLGAEAVGRKINLGVQRGGSPLSIDIVIGERPRA